MIFLLIASTRSFLNILEHFQKSMFEVLSSQLSFSLL